MNFKKLLHSLTLRLPQSIALRSGLRLNTYNKKDNSLFWSIFTSSEYLSLMPDIIKSGIRPELVIDCGAACGYFSLMIEHFCRAEVLDWEVSYLLVEPSEYNFKKLQKNFSQAGLSQKTILEKKVAGKSEGSITFYESKTSPWSSSIHNRTSINSKKVTHSYINLNPYLDQKNCFLKIDIEGGEYDFIDTYASHFGKVSGIIIEWHHEMGDTEKAIQQINEAGLYLIKTSFEKDNRRVDLFLKK
ncbi:MAG TPA: FkbM family methyltransferase [Saprospiraceae bacterium]|nr:FkbM family methyltransferase [Saprospiraceae bacterium]